jgi:hypothetical protein
MASRLRLSANVSACTEGMSAAQRVSRGFHWLAIFFAAILLLAGCALSVVLAKGFANSELLNHEKTACVHQWVTNKDADDATKRAKQRECTGNEFPKCTVEELLAQVDVDPTPNESIVYLKDVGCSDKATDITSFGEARTPPSSFNWKIPFVTWLAISLGPTLAASFVAYGTVRAIGWVIGGFFAAS